MYGIVSGASVPSAYTDCSCAEADFYLPSTLGPSVVLPDCGVGYLDDFLNLPSSCRPAFLKGGFTVGRLPLRYLAFIRGLQALSAHPA